MNYYGTYTTRNNEHIRYMIGADYSTRKVVIKWECENGEAGHKLVPLRILNNDVVWKLTKTGVSTCNPADMMRVFESFDGYANKTFSHFTGIR